MGKGNIHAGTHDTVYYVDYDNIYTYENKSTQETRIGKDIAVNEMDDYDFCDDLTQENYNRLIEELREHMCRIKDQFQPADAMVSRTRRIIAETDTFFLGVEDNQWSLAVELLWRKDYDADKQHMFEANRKEMLGFLLERFGSVGYRTSSWTHGVISATNCTA